MSKRGSAGKIKSSLALILLFSGLTAAQSGGDAATCFDIPAQPLESALSRFSASTNLQMLYDATLSDGRRSAALHACVNPRLAIVQMLEGTGLMARFTQGGSIVLFENSAITVVLNPITAEALPLIGAAPPDEEALAYARRVQQEMLKALHRADPASPDSYRLSLRIWFDGAGAINRAEILKGSGDIAVDEAFIVTALTVQAGAPPPKNMRQPIRIEFTGRRPH